jgi:tetraacyldisaccharide 4'-kinase
MKSGWLYPFSILYQLMSRLNRILYRWGLFKTQSAPLPVVSAGNIGFGGSGKTPLAQSLLAFLSTRGYNPALVTRGYKGRWEKTGGRILPGKAKDADWRQAGDEPYMLALSLPDAGIYIGKNKIRSCQAARKAGHDIAVLDDGFQHLRLYKDVDIVIHPPDKAGLKREPASSLRFADMILFKKDISSEQKRFLAGKTGQARLYAYSVQPAGIIHVPSGQPVTPQELNHTPFSAFCGIARPDRFRELIRRLGLQPREFLTFPDHHDYPAASMNKIRNHFSASGSKAGLTTEKDAVKLGALVSAPGLQIWVLKIKLDIEPAFYQDLERRLAALTQQTKK